MGSAQAALIDRGGGLLYDDVLNVTWLQDAHSALDSGDDFGGKLSWGAANTWVANLSFHDSVRNVDYTDWRLPTTAPVGADWSYDEAFDGSTDRGYNITSQSSELSYMFYVNLGLKAAFSATGDEQHNIGVFGDWQITDHGGQSKNVGLVKNLMSNVYWSGTAYAPNSANTAWTFDTSNGQQSNYYQNGTSLRLGSP